MDDVLHTNSSCTVSGGDDPTDTMGDGGMHLHRELQPRRKR